MPGWLYFQVSQEEAAKAERWLSRHRCTVRTETPPAAGGRVSYEFTPTGIGTVIVVRCACGKSKNVTDYEGW